MSIATLPAPPPPPPPPPPINMHSTALGWLETGAKACQLVATILALITPIALVGVNYMTSRYLAAFGQPGLSSFGDVASYSTAILPVVLPILILTGGFAALPVLPRWMAATPSRHAFTEAFGWLKPGHHGKWRGLGFYAMAHTGGLVTGALLILACFAPKSWNYLWWLPIAAALATLIWTILRSPKGDPQEQAKYSFQSILVFIYANFVLAAWLAVLGSAALGLLRPHLEPLHPLLSSALAAGILFGLLSLHFLASVSRWEAALLIVLAMGFAMLSMPGDRALTSLTLRYAKLGGGLPIAYRPHDAAENTQPMTACLVLAAGDTRIVWLPPAEQGVLAPCDFRQFQDRLRAGTQASAAGRLYDTTDVRSLKRENFL